MNSKWLLDSSGSAKTKSAELNRPTIIRCVLPAAFESATGGSSILIAGQDGSSRDTGGLIGGNPIVREKIPLPFSSAVFGGVTGMEILFAGLRLDRIVPPSLRKHGERTMFFHSEIRGTRLNYAHVM